MIENLRFLSEFSLRLNKRVVLIIQLHTQTYSITSFNRFWFLFVGLTE